nr:YkgJ family cysteine cluster protein [Lachnospiraceae bacterium]
MIRNIDLSKVTDNRLYTKDDIVNISCDGCKGCSDCCKSVGDSIILDPFDMYNLSKATGKSFEALMEDVIEIRLIDNIILPNMMISDETGCKMLDENGRCSIHALRPGFCR